jgi:transcriptional regulator GlxA family with amidase domain
VAEAARLLRTEDITVSQAAWRVGFRNIRALERAFQRFCGKSPAEYKTDLRPERNR